MIKFETDVPQPQNPSPPILMHVGSGIWDEKHNLDSDESDGLFTGPNAEIGLCYAFSAACWPTDLIMWA